MVSCSGLLAVESIKPSK